MILPTRIFFKNFHLSQEKTNQPHYHLLPPQPPGLSIAGFRKPTLRNLTQAVSITIPTFAPDDELRHSSVCGRDAGPGGAVGFLAPQPGHALVPGRGRANPNHLGRTKNGAGLSARTPGSAFLPCSSTE